MGELVVFSFKAKTGKEREFEQLLNNAESARRTAKAMGASRNALFMGSGRMIRVLEFPEGVKPVPLARLAEENPEVKAFLRKLGPLIEDGFDVDRPGSLEAFNQHHAFHKFFDVRP